MTAEQGQPRQFCSQCGNQVRSDTVFCVSCGARLDGSREDRTDPNVHPPPHDLHRQDGPLSNLDTPQLAMLTIAGILGLVMVYLLLSYSVILSVLLIGASAFAVLWVRKRQGNQTDFERQIFSKAGQYRRTAQHAYSETNTKYQRWTQEQAAKRERDTVLRQVEEERIKRRSELSRYERFFDKAYTGTQTSLDWWQAYDDGETKEHADIPELLRSAVDRGHRSLTYLRDYKQEFEDILRADRLGEADQILAEYRGSQEDLEGDDSVFPPLVSVHEKIKRSDYWSNYRNQLEHFIKELEDLLASPNVRTAPANRVRFPDPSNIGSTSTAAMSTPSTQQGSRVQGKANPVEGYYPSQPSPSPGISPQAYIDMVIAYMVSQGFLVDNRSDTSVTFARNGEDIEGASCLILVVLLLAGLIPGILYAMYMNSRRIHTNLVAIPTPEGIKPVISGNDKRGCSKLQDWLGVHRVH